MGPRLRAVQPSGSTPFTILHLYYILYYYKLTYSPIPLRYAGRREMFSEKKNPLPFRTDGKVKLSRPKRVENGTSPPLPPAPGDSPGPFNDGLYKNNYLQDDRVKPVNRTRRALRHAAIRPTSTSEVDETAARLAHDSSESPRGVADAHDRSRTAPPHRPAGTAGKYVFGRKRTRDTNIVSHRRPLAFPPVY